MSLIRTLTAYDAYFRQEFGTSMPGLAWRLRSLVSGHLSHSLLMLEEDTLRRRDYVAFLRYYRRLLFHNRRLSVALHNKVNQKFWLDAMMPRAAPPVTHYLASRQLVPIYRRGERHGLETVLSLARQNGRLFLKPSDQGQGVGAMVIEAAKGGFLVNGKPTAATDLIDRLSHPAFDGFAVSEFIRQDDWSASFFPSTLNTLRVLTGTFIAGHEPVILAATMKMGRPSTFPVDNWKVGRGGIAARVDIGTGRLASGLIFNVEAKRREWQDEHPDTGVRIKDSQVPAWDSIVSTMLELAGLLPFPGLIGWDIALTPSGPIVVEANTRPGLDIHQCHQSLRSTPEQRAFWAEMRV